MSLEDLEQRCLAYLKQVSRPLAPVDAVLAYLQREEGTDISRQELLEFLRRHELFRVIEPPWGDAGSGQGQELAELGLPVGPYVILCTRVPAEDESRALMIEQMDSLIEALESALHEAERAGDMQRCQGVNALLERARAIRRRLLESR